MQQSSGWMMWTDFQKTMMWRLVVALAFLSWSSADVTCKNQSGHSVDWFILYKADNSLEYFYIDPTKAEWSSSLIDDQNGCLGRTLEPYISPNDKTGFIAYNDQPPGCTPNRLYGHSKGLIMMDADSVVWLLHSTPNFPFKKTRFYPSSGGTFAQTFICVTFDKAEAPKIAHHLQYIRAYRFKDRELSGYSDLFDDDENKDPNTLQVQYQDLTSSGNTKFRSFIKKVLKDDDDDDDGEPSSKKPRNNNAAASAQNSSSEDEDEAAAEVGDLYVTIAENIAKTYVEVQSWGRQPKPAGPYCPQNKKHVHNVKSVEISDANKKKSWKNTDDHSKWCVSDSDWTCFGDSNRSRSQFERPGGALCIQDKRVTKIFKKFIKDAQRCKHKPKPLSSH